MFRALGFTEAEAQEKFGFLLDAFRYGTPPHGGIAFGFDRLTMLLLGCDSIRDVIPFPKTTSGLCLMTGSPGTVDDKQLRGAVHRRGDEISRVRDAPFPKGTAMRKTRMFLILGLALAAVAALAAEISIDADRTVDFSAFKTYAWKANDKASDPLVDQAIVADIEEQLAAKGLKKVEGPPDLFVQYHVILQKEAKLTDWDEGKFKFENRNITVQRLTVGTLLVDLVDAKTGAVVWRGRRHGLRHRQGVLSGICRGAEEEHRPDVHDVPAEKDLRPNTSLPHTRERPGNRRAVLVVVASMVCAPTGRTPACGDPR